MFLNMEWSWRTLILRVINIMSFFIFRIWIGNTQLQNSGSATAPQVQYALSLSLRARPQACVCLSRMDAWVTEGCRWRCVAFELSCRIVSGTAHLLLTLRSIHGGSLPLFTWAGDDSGSHSSTVPPLGWHGLQYGEDEWYRVIMLDYWCKRVTWVTW